MFGYKALNSDLTNRYGFKYEIGKLYKLNGDLKWKENGFHFCSYPEDTLRYVNAYKDDIAITYVEGDGELVEYFDNYYDFYDMYASSQMTILKIIPREEIFEQLINSGNTNRIKRYASLRELTQDEKSIIKSLYPELNNTLNYYQNDEYVLKRKRELY